MTYENQINEQVPVFDQVTIEHCAGFLSISADREYGDKVPLVVLAKKYPDLTFGGVYVHNHMSSAYTFESRGGELTDRAVENGCKGRMLLCYDEVVQSRVKNITAKMESMNYALDYWKKEQKQD
jgi:hypothetical protein